MIEANAIVRLVGCGKEKTAMAVAVWYNGLCVSQ
jgi:hypothetical protein